MDGAVVHPADAVLVHGDRRKIVTKGLHKSLAAVCGIVNLRSPLPVHIVRAAGELPVLRTGIAFRCNHNVLGIIRIDGNTAIGTAILIIGIGHINNVVFRSVVIQ